MLTIFVKLLNLDVHGSPGYDSKGFYQNVKNQTTTGNN